MIWTESARLVGHTESINCLAVVAGVVKDEMFIVSSGADGKVMVWQKRAGKYNSI